MSAFGDEVLAFWRYVTAIALNAHLAVPMPSLRRLLQLNRSHEDVAKPGVDRTHLGHNALRQAIGGRSKALSDLLASKVNVGLIREDRSDLVKAIPVEQAGIFKAGNARQRCRYGKRYLSSIWSGDKEGAITLTCTWCS